MNQKTIFNVFPSLSVDYARAERFVTECVCEYEQFLEHLARFGCNKQNSTGPIFAHLPWKFFLFFLQGRTNGLSEPIHLAVLPALLQGAKFGQMWPRIERETCIGCFMTLRSRSDGTWCTELSWVSFGVGRRDVAHTIESIYQYYSNKVYSGRTCM